MAVYTGPTANLPGRARRSGRAMTVWSEGRMLGEVIACEWNVNIEQIPVVISGQWRTEQKPGGEERAGTFRFQDVDDRWQLLVYEFVKARRNGDRTAAAALPEFQLQTKLDDNGAPDQSRWQLDGCTLFEYGGGGSVEDSLLIREVPFSFRSERALHTYKYGDSGLIITED